MCFWNQHDRHFATSIWQQCQGLPTHEVPQVGNCQMQHALFCNMDDLCKHMCRYAHHVMVKTSRKSHSVEARQILKYWGSLQQSCSLKVLLRVIPLKHCRLIACLRLYDWSYTFALQRFEKRQIQHQTGLTMQQVQNWLSNFKKRNSPVQINKLASKWGVVHNGALCHMISARGFENKEKMLFSDHNGSLPRQQPGAVIIGCSPKEKKNLCWGVD